MDLFDIQFTKENLKLIDSWADNVANGVSRFKITRETPPDDVDSNKDQEETTNVVLESDANKNSNLYNQPAIIVKGFLI